MTIDKFDWSFTKFFERQNKKNRSIFKCELKKKFYFFRIFLKFFSSRFSRHLLTHRKFVFEQYKVEYCFIRETLARAEEILSDIQLYRRPFGYIFFAVCQTTDELRSALNEFHKFRQCKSQAFAHLFIRYKNADRKFSEENASNQIVSFR